MLIIVHTMDLIKLTIFITLSVISAGECPRGWLHFAHKCYFFSHDALTWYEASYVCEAHHSKLATVETPEENDFLKLEAEARTGSFWLGGSDDFVEGDWRWVDPDSKFNFTDWGNNQPDDWGKNEDCLMLYDVGKWKWYDTTCSSRGPKFICEQDQGISTSGQNAEFPTETPIILQALSATSAGECPRGWLHFEHKCYFFSHETLSWYESSYVCEAHHSKLAIVETPEENDFLKLEAEARTGSFWLGGSDDFVEGDWRWVDPDMKFNFTDWGNNQPDDWGKNEDCLILYDVGKWKWYDTTCSYRSSKFICEQNYPGHQTD